MAAIRFALANGLQERQIGGMSLINLYRTFVFHGARIPLIVTSVSDTAVLRHRTRPHSH
jgi:hypothetical protein